MCRVQSIGMIIVWVPVLLVLVLIFLLRMVLRSLLCQLYILLMLLLLFPQRCLLLLLFRLLLRIRVRRCLQLLPLHHPHMMMCRLIMVVAAIVMVGVMHFVNVVTSVAVGYVMVVCIVNGRGLVVIDAIDVAATVTVVATIVSVVAGCGCGCGYC